MYCGRSSPRRQRRARPGQPPPRSPAACAESGESEKSLRSSDPAAHRAARAYRNTVVRPGNQRPRYRRRVARTACRVEGAESPEIVEEWLEELRGKEVRDERL